MPFPLAVQALESNRAILKIRTAKTVFDLYNDDLHKTEEYLQYCPLCQVKKDSADHIYACFDHNAAALVVYALVDHSSFRYHKNLTV